MVCLLKTTKRQVKNLDKNATSESILQDRAAFDCRLSLRTKSLSLGILAGAMLWALGASSASAQTVGVPQRLPAASKPSSNFEPQIRKFRVPPNQVLPLSTKLGLMYRDEPNVQITSDTRSGDLIVMASAAMQAKVQADLRTLLAAQRTDVHQDSNEPITYQLRNVSWQTAEQQFSLFSGSPPSVTSSPRGQQASFRLSSPRMMGTTITVDRRHNRVIVDTIASKVMAWKRVLVMVDSQAKSRDGVTVVVRLEKAEPAPIQRALRLLSTVKRRKNLSDSRNHSSRGSIRPVAFQPPPPSAPGQSNATPRTVGDSNDKDGDDNESGSGLIGETQIEFVPELGTIIIKGAQRDVQRVMDVIKQIEEQSEVTQPSVEVVSLQHADSNAVADLLKQLYDDVLSARQGTVSITSLDAPNALLLIGRSEAIKSLLELIQKIDQPIDESNGLRVFRLQHASATDAEQILRDFFTDRPGEGEDRRPGLGNRIRILADYRTNSLILSASPRDLKEASRLIDELDTPQSSSQSQIKVFQLRNALAEDLAPVIQSAIDSPTEGSGSNQTPPSSSLSIVELGSESGHLLESGVLSSVVVTADSGANSIVVRGPIRSMPLIGELIQQLDRAPGIDSLVKVFTIENGDALQLTVALQDLFGDNASTNGTSVGAGNLAGLPPSTGGVESSLVPLRFSTDQRTNSIVASGSAEDLDVVESILLRLDSEGFAQRITEVIWLRHQTAADVAAALQQYVQQRTQTVNTIQQFQQGLGPFDLPDRDLIVVAEPVTNSLLLSVSPRMYEDVRRLIDRLDRRPPMVLIKVVIAEVTLGDRFEIGGEFGLQDSLVYDRGIAAGAFAGATPPSTPGFNFNNNGLDGLNSFGQGTVAARGLSSLGVGTTSSGVNYGGFVLSAASDSVSMLLRTLQTSNRLQILSRPQVMAMDNTEGFVQVGRQIARVTDIINNGVSGTQVVTEDIEVGLILRVRPRVGADGLIIMDIDATRSQRDPTQGTQVPVAGGLGAITIDDIVRTTAQSVVAAYSGQTVIFGGLIQKERNVESRRIPIVAEIPVIGNLFKYDIQTEVRTELLTILTPLLITGEEDLDYVKQVESSRMSWCLADVVEMHGDVGLSGGYGLWGPAVGQTIYPDRQPTIDDIVINEDYSIEQNASSLSSSSMNSSAFSKGEEVVSGSVTYESPRVFSEAVPTSEVPAPTPSIPTQTIPAPSNPPPTLDLPSNGFPTPAELPAPPVYLPGSVQPVMGLPAKKPAIEPPQAPSTPEVPVSWEELVNQSESTK